MTRRVDAGQPDPALTPPSVLLTGATGFMGREVLVRLLRQGHPVLAVTRAAPGERPDGEGPGRIHALAAEVDPGAPLGGLTAAWADITQPGLGLSPGGRAWLAAQERVQVVHGAAEVRFDLPLGLMRERNVQGTLHVLELARTLAEQGRLHRLEHISTCYVAGDREDRVLESEVDVGQRARNAYERTKLEAEVAVAAARQEGLPITVHRPSIIVGDSRTGRASTFKVLYWPMKVYARGRFRTVFGRPGCPVDVVPVDYVADAVVHLMGRPEAAGRTFHLAAGPEGQSTIAALAAQAQEIFQRRPVRYIDPDLYLKWLRPIVRPILRLVRPDVAERGGVYLPYLKGNPSFDTTEARGLLAPAGLAAPRVEDYFGRIMRFALETDFGRRALPAYSSSAR